MTTLKQAVRTFWNDEEGATAIEYGLLVSLIAVVIIAFVHTIGDRLGCAFSYVATCLSTSGCPAAGYSCGAG